MVVTTKTEWSPAEDALLGTDYDVKIAARMGLKAKQVEHRRNALGIPPVAPREWTPEEEALLGADTLAKLSVRLDRPTSQIHKRMKQLGITSYGAVRDAEDKELSARKAAKAAEKKALDGRNEDRSRRRKINGIAVVSRLGKGCTLTEASKELDLAYEVARRHLLIFLRLARHPNRLGIAVPNVWTEIHVSLFAEMARRMENELKTGSLAAWRDPLQDK